MEDTDKVKTTKQSVIPQRPIARASEWGRSNASPLAVVGSAGMLAGALAYGLYNPVRRTLRTLGARVTGERVDEINKTPANWKTKLKGAALAGALASLGTYAIMDKRPRNMTKWGSFMDTGFDGMDIDYGKRINGIQAASLFNNDPHFDDNPYIKYFGTSVVANACNTQNTTKPTLGSIFDSAARKFQSRLSLSGIAPTMASATIANAQANLLTGALGTMMDLDKGTRNALVEAGTWAGTIKSILE
jgi:hypothetical protein